MIRLAEAVRADYPALLAMNEAAIPAVNRIDEAVLQDLHRQAAGLIVARDADRIAGFLLALDHGADYHSPNFRYFQRHYDRFVYVDRIVVAAHFRRQRVGVHLYEALFERAHEPIISCEVNIVPPNPASLAFHERLGFEVVDEQDTEGGSKRVALMVRAATRSRS